MTILWHMIMSCSRGTGALYAIDLVPRSLYVQGRHRVFKSGPAEEAMECPRHERGIIPPLVRGVWGASPEIKFEF